MDKKYDISKELEEVAAIDAPNEKLEETSSAIEKGMDGLDLFTEIRR